MSVAMGVLPRPARKEGILSQFACPGLFNGCAKGARDKCSARRVVRSSRDRSYQTGTCGKSRSATIREDPHLFQEIAWDEPTDVRATFNGEARRRKYFETLESGRKDRLLLSFGQYICRNWNDIHGGTASELLTFDIVDVKEPTRKRGRRDPVEQNVLWSHVC
jgi:hypothetical protein